MSIQPIRLGTIGETTAGDAGMCCGGASCAVPNDVVASASSDTTSVDREVRVTGMTCAHCVSAVTQELSALDGVDGVAVELVVGGESRVSFRAPADLDDVAIAAAVEEAGYSLA